MEPAIIESSFVKDSFQKPVDKLLENPISLVLIPETPVKDSEETSKSKLDLKCISSQVAVLDDDCNSHTPKESVFDPFVKGSEQHLEDPHGMISRRLDFELLGVKCDADPEKESVVVLDCDDDDDGRLLETVLSENLLDTIVSEQADELLLLLPASVSVFVSVADDDDDDDYELLFADGFKTPTSMASSSSVSGIGEICPAAPRKPAKTGRTFKFDDINLCCRKLQF